VNGAAAIAGSLRAHGVGLCFANPGTSELHLVEAFESTPGLRSVLCLFEGVATGAAGGFGRMGGVPAATLLHQGAGLANGMANLHNAGRAASPVVTVVGDGATSHAGLGAPLESDVAALAAPMSRWVRTAGSAATAGSDTAAAVSAARRAPGPVTLVVPADVAWSEGGVVCPPGSAPDVAASVPAGRVEAIARSLRERPGAALLVGGGALRGPGLAAAARLARVAGLTVLAEAFPARLEQGAGVPAVERLSGDPGRARGRLTGIDRLILAGARAPVAAFAQPGTPGALTAPGCVIEALAAPGEDATAALQGLAELLAPGVRARPANPVATTAWAPGSALDAATAVQVVAAALPEGAILVDESNSSGAALPAATAAAAPHDLLAVCGFAIGEGLPLSIGAALASPGRPIVCLESDGSAMYTLSALWTQAREGLDITTVVLDNGGYSILRRESRRTLGAGTPTAGSPLFDLGGPRLDFAALGAGLGVPSARAATAAELDLQLKRALAEPGPHLVVVSLPSL
jgi:acetolactate synthase-1/2/3 large subunit